MGIFFPVLTLLCVCLLFLSLSLLRALGWGCSLGFCLLLREMAAGVLVGLVVGFLYRVFFFFPSPPIPLPALVPWLQLRSEPRRSPSQEGGGSGSAANGRAGPGGPASPDWLALTSSCSRAAAAGQGRELPEEAKGENGRHDLSAREDFAGRASPKSWRKEKQDQAWASSRIVPGLC